MITIICVIKFDFDKFLLKTYIVIRFLIEFYPSIKEIFFDIFNLLLMIISYM